MRRTSIVVVEDDGPVRLTVCEVLESSGYDVHGFATAEAALDEMGRMQDVALLVADIVLPGMDGIAMAAHWESLRPGARSLLMTGAGGEFATPRTILRKPFRVQELIDSVRRVLAEGVPEGVAPTIAGRQFGLPSEQSAPSA